MHENIAFFRKRGEANKTSFIQYKRKKILIIKAASKLELVCFQEKQNVYRAQAKSGWMM